MNSKTRKNVEITLPWSKEQCDHNHDRDNQGNQQASETRCCRGGLGAIGPGLDF